MQEKNATMTKKKSSLCGKGVIGLYVCAALSLICGGFMLYYSITYVQNYYASYGISISEGIKDVIQYVISATGSYIGFTILFFVAAVILKKVDRLGTVQQEETVIPQTSVLAEPVEEQTVEESAAEPENAEAEDEEVSTEEMSSEEEAEVETADSNKSEKTENDEVDKEKTEN